MKKPLKKIFQEWLLANPGWHNKSALLELTWNHHESYKKYNKDTCASTLREAEREGLIVKDIRKGQTWYSVSAETAESKRKKAGIKMIEEDGVRKMLYG
jgi:hypothetical protein